MLGFLDELCHINIGFFQWMIWGFVAMVIYFIIAYIVLSKMFPADVKRIEGAHEFVEERRKALGKWTLAQKNTMVGFAIAVTLWITPGILSMIYGSSSPVVKSYNHLFPEAIAAMVGALVLFVLPGGKNEKGKPRPVITWKQAVDGIEWGTLLLFGGGLAMGGMMYSLGLSQWVGDNIVGWMGGEPSQLLLVAVFCVVSLLMSELTSHTAATNMVGPLAIGAAVAAGYNPVPVAVGVALSASLGFMLPVSTPPNAIVYASGYVPITKMIKTGVVIDFIGIAFVTIPIVLYLVNLIL